MNKATLKFFEYLKKDKDVLGIILFGSWARGNNRPDSDVDLVVIKKGGFKRCVEYLDKQAFEIIYTTPQGAIDFWKKNLDDCAGLWGVAKIVYDRDGTIGKLQGEAMKLLSNGKKNLDTDTIGHLRFDADDSIKAIEVISEAEPQNAEFLLNNKIFTLVGLYFDLRGNWKPAPKQMLGEIKKSDSATHQILLNFYTEKNLKSKIKIAKKIVEKVFKL